MRIAAFCWTVCCVALLAASSRAQAPADTPVANPKIEKQLALIKTLADDHGYKLAEGEPFKFIKDPQNQERHEVRKLMMPPGLPADAQPKEGFDPFSLVLHALPEGTIVSGTSSGGVVTLSEVLDHVLHVKRYELDCPPNLLMTYMPGDWVTVSLPDKRQIASEAGATALEKILNEQCGLNVKVHWKTEERPALVLKGKYKPNPISSEGKGVSPDYDGSFGIPARRDHRAGESGTYEMFMQSLGETLLLPVIDEAEVSPAKKYFVWIHSGTPVKNSARLPADDESRVIDALREQLGYEIVIEPREILILSIQPAGN